MTKQYYNSTERYKSCPPSKNDIPIYKILLFVKLPKPNREVESGGVVPWLLDTRPVIVSAGRERINDSPEKGSESTQRRLFVLIVLYVYTQYT